MPETHHAASRMPAAAKGSFISVGEIAEFPGTSPTLAGGGETRGPLSALCSPGGASPSTPTPAACPGQPAAMWPSRGTARRPPFPVGRAARSLFFPPYLYLPLPGARRCRRSPALRGPGTRGSGPCGGSAGVGAPSGGGREPLVSRWGAASEHVRAAGMRSAGGQQRPCLRPHLPSAPGDPPPAG